MSRTWPVVEREFTEMVRTKAFVVGTVLGPLLIVGMIALQVALARAGGGERRIAVVAAGDGAVAREVAAALAEPAPGAAGEERTRFEAEVGEAGGGDPDALRAELVRRIEAEELDGYLWLPAGVVDGEAALYEGTNATNFGELERIRAAVQMAVQGVRLRSSGIDPRRVEDALRPVPFEARKTGGKAASGTPAALFVLTYILGLATYMVVILYGNAVMRGVLEEKRDRIVEVIVSSIRADQLMTGKVVGIGGAGMLQIGIWIGFAALALAFGGDVATRLGGRPPELPDVPGSVAAVFLFFFSAGFFLYAGVYAAMGAIATTDQEAQQLQIPVILPLVVALSMMGTVLNDPSGAVAVAGSLVPLTAPVVMPMRAAVSEVPWPQLAGSAAVMLATAFAVLRIAAKVYRTGILATGKRATMAEVWRWLRST